LWHSSRTTYPSKRVAIIGHPAGGFIVSSYPGKYHDVAAMVQANAPSGLSSTSPPGNAALVSAGAPPARGSMDEKYGFIGDAWTDGHARPTPTGYSDQALPTRTACEDFDLWRPQLWHMRRCTHEPPLARHSAQPSIRSGNSRNSI
jgi:hypothetical protein